MSVKKEKSEVYLYIYTDQKTQEYRLVDEEIDDFVHSPYPSFTSSRQEKLPQKCIDAQVVAMGSEYDSEEFETCEVTVGSFENDRALAVYQLFDGKLAEFYDVLSMFKFAAEHNLAIIGERLWQQY